MIRSDVIAILCQKYPKLDSALVDNAVRLILDTMSDALLKDERIEIRKFGVFEVRERTARRAYNPKTGLQVEIPNRRMAHFKAGSILKERINLAQNWSRRK